MEQRRKKNRIALLVTLLVIALIVAIPFIVEARKKKTGGLGKNDVISGKPEVVTMEKALSGTGTLASEEAEKIQLPGGVEITRYLVSNNQEVTAGTRLASVDKATVMTAIQLCQERLEKIEKDMDAQRNWLAFKDLSGEQDGIPFGFRFYTSYNDSDLHDYIYSPVAGIVTSVYAQKGDSVRDVILNYGCLAIVSFDNGYEYKVTAANGDVNYVYVEVGDTVKSGQALFYLENCTNDAQVEILAAKHRKYEDVMEQLSKLYLDEYILAPCDGVITGIDEDAASKLETKFKNSHIIQADVIAGSSEITITCKIATVTDDEIVLMYNGQTLTPIPLEEYRDKFDPDGSTLDKKTDIGKEVSVTYSLSNTMHLSFKSASNVHSYAEEVSGGVVSNKTTVQAKDDDSLINKKTYMSVTPQDKMTISMSIDELDILQVRPGMETMITIDAFPGKAYAGEITEINTTASNNGGNSKYSAVVTIERESTMIPGMNASVLIPVETFENILAVPVKAITEIGTKSVVYTSYDARTGMFSNPLEIKTGVSDGEYAEVLSGISGNETFWYEYTDEIDIDEMRRSGSSSVSDLLLKYGLY